MRCALFVAALLACSPSLAHDTWLLPDSRPPQGEIAVLLSTGARYPAADIVGAPEGAFRVARDGVVTVWVTLAEAVVELTEAQVDAYFDEIDAPDHVRRAWAGAGAGRRWREAYTKFAKTVVAIGAPGAAGSWRSPVGQRLEIVPESDPRALRVGATLRVRVWQEGRPLPGLAVFCVDPQGRIGGKGHTDAAGRISCPLTIPGAWLVRGTELRRARAGGAGWESLWATLTVQVAP